MVNAVIKPWKEAYKVGKTVCAGWIQKTPPMRSAIAKKTSETGHSASTVNCFRLSIKSKDYAKDRGGLRDAGKGLDTAAYRKKWSRAKKNF